MKIVFMGTSLFAAVILRDLMAWSAQHKSFEVCALYCQPDRPSGRGHKLVPPPTKAVATELGIPVFQPLNFKNEEDCKTLRELQPDMLVVASYGLILPQNVLDIPSIAPINVHASLLPKYRGAAPIERALMNGDIITGVSIMRMEAGLDTGPIIAQRAMGIGLDDTAGILHEELAHLGAEVLQDVLIESENGTLPRTTPQENSLSNYASKLSKNDGFIDWNRPVRSIHAHIRGVTPRPSARVLFELDGKQIPAKIMPSKLGRNFFIPYEENAPRPVAGSILGLKNGCLAVACTDAMYLIPEICPADRKFMDATAFWNGYIRSATSARVLIPNE